MQKSAKNKKENIKEPEIIKIGKYNFTPILVNKKVAKNLLKK
ncbi:hypothetical protein AB8U03_15785 [Clostridium sp. Mt-5]|uniref:Uncharacterized protein n=1 Tax=Clostridium moutaii TaxID=3240932 RepID=A0ABV4BVB6_9CLOT